MESQLDYDPVTMYQTIDDCNLGGIDLKSLSDFFKKTKTYAIDIESCAAIIRRLDLNMDSRLNKDEFLKGMAPQEPFSRMLVR